MNQSELGTDDVLEHQRPFQYGLIQLLLGRVVWIRVDGGGDSPRRVMARTTTDQPDRAWTHSQQLHVHGSIRSRRLSKVAIVRAHEKAMVGGKDFLNEPSPGGHAATVS
jgi:hypothetical protein